MNDWINRLKESSLKEFNNLAGMFENWKKEIINSFIQFGERRLHNGYIEGVINHIKEIKRILIALQTTDAFGVSRPADWVPGNPIIEP